MGNLRDEFQEASIDMLVMMPDTCDILGVAIGEEDEYGGHSGDTVVTLSDVPCRFAVLSGREADNAARTNDSAVYGLTLPLWTVIDNDSRVVYGGKTYPVLQVITGSLRMDTRVWLGRPS